MPSIEDDSLRTEQGYSIELGSSIPSQLMQSNESPLILKKIDDKNQQEGIEDAFSKDQGDRFQPKAEGRPPNEKTNEGQSGKETPDAQQ